MGKELDVRKNISIKSYMEQLGFSFVQRSSLYFCKSPFTKDTTWSFTWYPITNTFYDWTQGFGGSIVDLVSKMYNVSIGEAINILGKDEHIQYKPNYKELKSNPSFYNFEYTRYVNVSEEEADKINLYARSRGIISGYECGVYFTPDLQGNWNRNLGIMYLHRDSDMKLCGAKFRKLPDGKDGMRFTSRGKMGIYLLEYVSPENYGEPTGYIVEGEGNANSLWQYCQAIKRNCIVGSFGGVGQFPDKLPDHFEKLSDKRLIIDYDGNEELYNKRLAQYSQFNLTPIKIRLDKGQDINWLLCNDKIDLIHSLL